MRLFQKTYRQKDPKTGKATGPRRKASTWSVRFSVGGEIFERSTGCRDKSAAAFEAAKMVREEELRAAGIETHAEVRDVPLEDLVQEFEKELLRRGRTDRYVRLTGTRIRTLCKGVSRVAKLTPERIRRALGRLELAPRTLNYYRVALHGFFAWLVMEQRWSTNPVDAVPTVRVVEKSRRRRALTATELAALLGVSPPERGIVYLVAATTGLRRGELAALTWADIDLDEATVLVRAATAKNRREDVLPLPPGTVEKLRSWRGAVTPSATVFESVPSVGALRRDLAEAGIEFETADGVIDFHALRVTFGTSLGRAGVPLALAQKLMRHSTPVLTANIYTRLELHDQHAAVAKIDLHTAPEQSNARHPKA